MIALAEMIRQIVRDELATHAANIKAPAVEHKQAPAALEVGDYLSTRPNVQEIPGDGNRSFWRSQRGRIMLRTRDADGPHANGDGTNRAFGVFWTEDGAVWQRKHVHVGTVYVVLPPTTKAIRIDDGEVSEEIPVPWDVTMVATGKDPR